MSRTDLVVAGKQVEALAMAERALAVAADADLPRPARALGLRGSSRCSLGDAGGLADFREALTLTIQAGRGRVEAALYNNLGIELRNFEGPRAGLETFATGLALAEARGFRDMALSTRASALQAMLGAGEFESLIAAASLLGQHAEEAGDERDLIVIRSVQAIALSYLGEARDAARFLGPLVDAIRQTGRHDLIAPGLAAVAVVGVALGKSAEAGVLLGEVEETQALGETSELTPSLPAIVRSAVAIGELDLAQRLTDRVAARSPYAEHALVAARSAIAEAKGETEGAAEAYAEAAARWEGFGVRPEHGFALLGQGRCLLALSRPGESSEVLQQARELFTRCGMRPALEETEALLAKATALSS